MAKKSNTRAKRKALTQQEVLRIEREAKRAEQKAAGALDGRYRTKKVESKKRYTRKKKPDIDEPLP